MTIQPAIILAVGSNHDATRRLPQAIDLLRSRFPDLTVSSWLTTPALGGKPMEPFTNCLAVSWAEMQPQEVVAVAKSVEASCGNTAEQRTEGHVCMDIDLLLCGQQRFHLPDWNLPYIQELMRNMHINTNI